MYNTKFVQKLAFAYRNCPLSLEITNYSTHTSTVSCDLALKIFSNCAVYDTVNGLYTGRGRAAKCNRVAVQRKF